MNSNNQPIGECLDKAANAIANDNRSALRDCLKSLDSMNCASACLMSAWASESLETTESHLQQVLEYEPENAVAVAGLNWIHGIQELANSHLEAKRKAEEEARQAEEAARTKAEEEARIKAEEEARIQAEEEASIQAEEAARQKTEAEAQAKAEDEARQIAVAKAKEESRIKTEQEARQMVEEEARAKAEEKARLQAEEEARLEIERARQEELERHAEFERHAELKRQAELERQADLERQAELKRKADLEREELAKYDQAANLVSASDLSLDTVTEVDSVDTPSASIESEIEEDVTTLVAEVEQAVQASSHNDSTISAVKDDGITKQVVMIIDDSPTLRMLVSLTLGKEGFEVIAAEDGVEACNILANQLPDIILTDINMPKLNGYKLCKFIKKHERTQAIPVVMLSGKDGVFDKMRGKLSGCDDYIVKPFETADLIAKVREILPAAATA